jgi:DNA repair protein RecO (recombination protein O)
MTAQETDAFILRAQDLGEADRLITFYAMEGGKLRGLAKGARRSRKRFVHVFEPCSLVRLEYQEKRSMVWIEACKLLDPHLALREDVGKWACGALICELILQLVPEGESQNELFPLLRQSMWQIAKERFPVNSVLVFLCRLMVILGYMPAISHCRVCGKMLRDDRIWGWDPTRGILLCAEHRSTSAGLISIDAGSLLLIEGVRNLPLESIWRLQFSSSRRLSLVRSLLDWVSHHTGKGFSAMRVVDQIPLA